MYTVVLAVALLMDPTLEAPHHEAVGQQMMLMAHIAEQAVEMQILDPREVRYVMARISDFDADLQLLRRRYDDLGGAPGVAESYRFPDRPITNDLLAFNRAYRAQMENSAQFAATNQHWQDCLAAMAEADRLYFIWDSVRDSRCEYYFITVRRQALLRLREAIGDDAFYTGQLPPPVPLWRFRSID